MCVVFMLLFLCISDDRHRVKLHSLLADPSSDYVNANYIDVSLLLFPACSISDLILVVFYGCS